MSIHRQRLGLYVPWGLFFIACIGWTVFWFAARDAAIKRLDAAIVQAHARGIEAGYTQARASGYPLHLTLTLRDAHLQMAPLPRLDAATLPVSVNLVDPNHLIIDLKDGVRWTGGDGVAHVLDPTRGAMSVHWKGAALARVSLDLEGAPTKALRIHVRPDARTTDAWQVALDVEGAESSTLRAGIVLDHAALLLAARGADPLGPWVDAGGRATVEVLDIRMLGATLTGSGAFTLDAQRRPEGEATLKAEGQMLALLALLGTRDNAGGPKLTAKDGRWRLGRLDSPAPPLYALPSSSPD